MSRIHAVTDRKEWLDQAKAAKASEQTKQLDELAGDIAKVNARVFGAKPGKFNSRCLHIVKASPDNGSGHTIVVGIFAIYENAKAAATAWETWHKDSEYHTRIILDEIQLDLAPQNDLAIEACKELMQAQDTGNKEILTAATMLASRALDEAAR